MILKYIRLLQEKRGKGNWYTENNEQNASLEVEDNIKFYEQTDILALQSLRIMEMYKQVLMHQ